MPARESNGATPRSPTVRSLHGLTAVRGDPRQAIPCRTMTADRWLADTRISYDTVAASYADQLRDALAGEPYLRASLALFAEMVHAAGGGPVADVGCGPSRHRPPARAGRRRLRYRPVTGDDRRGAARPPEPALRGGLDDRSAPPRRPAAAGLSRRRRDTAEDSRLRRSPDEGLRPPPSA